MCVSAIFVPYKNYSCKIFFGRPTKIVISLDEITASFRRFGPLVVDWPHKAESKSYFVIAVGSGSPRDSIDIKFSGSIISIEPPALEVDDIIELCINVSIGFDLVVIKFVGVILPKKCSSYAQNPNKI